MKIRAKFTLVSHTHLSYGHGSHGHTFEFAPQYDTSIPEDQRFSKATPNGNFKMTVDNPPVIEYLADKHNISGWNTAEVSVPDNNRRNARIRSI